MVQQNYLEKMKPFFKDGVDFTKIENPKDLLDLPFESLKSMDSQWKPFFEDVDLTTIKELAQYEDSLEIEGINSEDLNKLAMISEMLFWKITQLVEMGDKKKKIVYLGLGNAGKTSALTALSEKYSSIKELLPTRGLRRQSTIVLGYDIMSFDFGGQDQYRDQYFQKADMYFSESDLMVYVIDIQDPDRFDESMTYFQKILDTYANFDLYIPILVVFSKMDPDICNNKDINKSRIKLIDDIEEKTEKFDVGYVNTSIYERNSIENLFSLSLKKISSTGGIIQELLKTFTNDIKARGCTLISSTGLVFGSYGKTHQEEEMLKNSAAYLQNLYLFHLTNGLEKEDFYELNYKRNNLHFISEFITTSESGMVYLWVLTSDLREEVLGISKFRDDLLPLIENFL